MNEQNTDDQNELEQEEEEARWEERRRLAHVAMTDPGNGAVPLERDLEEAEKQGYRLINIGEMVLSGAQYLLIDKADGSLSPFDFLEEVREHLAESSHDELEEETQEHEEARRAQWRREAEEALPSADMLEEMERQGLVDIVGERNGRLAYRITDRGRDWLSALAAVREPDPSPVPDPWSFPGETPGVPDPWERMSTTGESR
jgi:hypothetical protein